MVYYTYLFSRNNIFLKVYPLNSYIINWGKTMERINCDVLVIGGGGAGLMAAYEASKGKVKVAVVSKGKVQRSGATIMAPGAIAGVDDRWKDPKDSKETHIADTIMGGSYLNDQDMVRVMAEEAPQLILELERMGAIWQRNEKGDNYLLRIDGGHSYPRCPYLEDRTGREMVRAMVGELRKRDVPFYEEIQITRILKEDNKVIGAVGINITNLEPVIFESKAVILATGGGGEVYANTDNPTDVTGDGYALALDAGVSLKDMEFIQFYPIGLLYPPSLKGMLGGLLYYSKLYNSKGERFMEKYDPQRLELSTRDRVSRAVMQEVMEGRGTPRGGVYCDLTFNEPGFIARMTPALNETYLKIGIDPTKDKFEIAPTCHFFMGGMVVDSNWESSLQGLFGAGEVAGGMHGGNRLSQNALAEILVSGVIAGRNAAKLAAKESKTYINPSETAAEKKKINDILSSKEGIKPSEYRKRIKNIMWENVGVFRTEESLNRALAEIESLQRTKIKLISDDKYYNKEVLETFENESLLITAKCIITAALNRKESRGAHFRSDYPQADNNNWLKNILIKKEQGNVKVSYSDVNLKILRPEVEQL
jgi:succinate dehydrogenase/fumarate reductase flavoprotein subunit